MNNQVELTDGVRAQIKQTVPIKEGVEVWRVKVNFLSDIPDKGRQLKEYFIWVTGEYLEDKAHLSANLESAEKFSLDLVKKRFEESNNSIPIENGVSCSNEEGQVIVNPKTYYHPLERQ